MIPLIAKALGADNDSVRVYVGTYTRGESKGIYVLDLDLETGALTSVALAAEANNPSFVALHPNGRFLYAVNEIGEFRGEESGAVSAFRIDGATGKLSLINQQPSLGGAPCYLAVDQSGRNVLVANYSGGSVASLPINPDGSLGEATSAIKHTGSSVHPSRQEGPHAHSINVDRTNRFALAADLGLDKVIIYPFDAESGVLNSADAKFAATKPGAGPRHLSFHPDGQYAYVVNELDLTITAFAFDSGPGNLTEIQTVSTLPGDTEPEYSTAEIRVHPSGKFLYASNRGHDSIAVFVIDPDSGKLTLFEHEPTQGRTPRNFAIDPSGRYLLVANQNSNSLVVFAVDQATGALTPTGNTAEVPKPVCVRLAP